MRRHLRAILTCVHRQRRRCVYCGYAGAFVQMGGAATGFECPACEGDLYARPARSYDEMEGFAPVAMEVLAPPSRAKRVAFVLVRWALAAARFVRPGAFAMRRPRVSGSMIEMGGGRRSVRSKSAHAGGRRGEGDAPNADGGARGRR